MRVGIFGGSFDPVHLGHLLLAEKCRETLSLDRLVFVPAGIPPHKRSRRISAGDDRAAMLELATGGCEEFEVSRFEIDRTETSFTLHTIRHFRETLPEAELFLVLGADMFHDLPHWYRAEEVLRHVIPAPAHRPGNPEIDFSILTPLVSEDRLARFRESVVEMPQIDLSSSHLRRQVAQGRSIRFQVPRAVEKYIETHRLYRETIPEKERQKDSDPPSCRGGSSTPRS